MKKILVTGGAGYIGSHFVVKLIDAGYQPIIYDDFSNSHKEVLNRIKLITGQDVECVIGDIRDEKKLNQVFLDNQFDSVVHFAGKKSVGESQREPLLYYSVNVAGTLSLLNLMKKHKVARIIFSSTATVYGDAGPVALPESSPLGPINNYGKSKLMAETIMESIAANDRTWSVCILRYFNPVGAHPSGLIGEDPNGIPANLMPFISQVAVGKRDFLRIFGNDYGTRDGTGARDYIHVEDLANAHIAALHYLDNNSGFNVFNIGTGQNTTVLEMVNTFSKVNNVNVPYEIQSRRPGDSGICFADPSKATKEMGWSAKYGLEEMCRDTWNWQKKNPNGYLG